LKDEFNFEKQKQIFFYLKKLNLSKNILSKKINEISGGEKRKIFILKILINKYDFIFLDEPTNDLDLKSIKFLTYWLNEKYKNGFLIHIFENEWVNKTTKKIWELSFSKINEFFGNYDSYISQKTHLEYIQKQKYLDYKKQVFKMKKEITKKTNVLQKANKKIKNKLKKKKISKFTAQTQKDGLSKLNIDIKKKKETIFENEKKDIYNDADFINLNYFDINFNSYNEVLTIENINYKNLFKNINLKILKGEKIGLIGNNGVGKTTLLNIITQTYKQDSGDIIIGKKVKMGYIKQNPKTYNIKIINYLQELFPNINTFELRKYLAKFLFHKNDYLKQVNILSGGELIRLELLIALLNQSNFLILDEPTNNLDINSITILESFLKKFKGTILLVSHDIMFLKNICNIVYELTPNGLKTQKEKDLFT